MSLARRFLVFVAVLACIVPGAGAQTVPLPLDVPLDGVTAYREAVPLPESVMGHQVGTRHTRPAQVVDYFEAVAAASDRVVLQGHGRTYEGRPLVHAVVSSPQNLARLDAIQAANVRLSEDPSAVSDAELAGQPAVVYMGYSVHGNEASGTEAALLLLYHLAAAEGASVDEVLAHTVVILDPMLNPDGRDRFVDWVNGNRGGVATSDPQDREHDEAWPGGRTNHYWFDLNRDWLPGQHPESQGRLAVFHAWRPQVLTDYHEMGGDATFFFQPGIPSRNNPNTPAGTYELTAAMAEYHARALDQIGALYYTRESFDDFYYGKGSTYPDVQGAVGILFEQASSRALSTETDFGVLSFAGTVRNQFMASLSTLEAVVDLRERLLRHQRDFYAEAPEVARAAEAKAYVVSLTEARTRAQALAQTLQRHRVRLHELARPVEADGRRFEPGRAYVVPLDQPQARFIKAAMERTTEYGDSLFYDVSTWTLPLAYGVAYGELRDAPGRALGGELGPVAFDGGAVHGGTASYAYLMTWDRYFAPRALHRFLEAGVHPLLLHQPVTAVVDGRERTFPRGTVVIPVRGRDDAVAADEVHALARTAAAEDHVALYAVATGLTPGGPDLGSRDATVLERPRIALLVGDGTSSYDAGEVWHLLTERFRIPISLLDAADVGRADLDRYNTLVLAGGWYGGLDGDAVQAWVRSGGRLIALGSAVGWAVEQGLAELDERRVDVDSLTRDVAYADLGAARGAQYLGGSIFEARLDATHPLAYGYGDRVPVFHRGSTFYGVPDAPGTTVGAYSDDPLLSGYLSQPLEEELRGSAAVVALRAGRGRVMLMPGNPNFRAFWYGTNGLFLNMVFLGGAY